MQAETTSLFLTSFLIQIHSCIIYKFILYSHLFIHTFLSVLPIYYIYFLNLIISILLLNLHTLFTLHITLLFIYTTHRLYLITFPYSFSIFFHHSQYKHLHFVQSAYYVNMNILYNFTPQLPIYPSPSNPQSHTRTIILINHTQSLAILTLTSLLPSYYLSTTLTYLKLNNINASIDLF